MSKKQSKNKSVQGTLRIIGGNWRGRKLGFPAVDGVRPTPDRVRETVFNWLMPVIHGSRCLDLFSGSGALGLEALSRGASDVVFIDQSREIITNLREHFKTLGTDKASAIQANATTWINNIEDASIQWDVVFLDPPFRKELLAPILNRLVTGQLLSPDSIVYIEAEEELNPLPLPSSLKMTKHKKAGQVQYCLCDYSPTKAIK